MNISQKLNIIKEKRKIAFQNDTPEFQEKRKKFLNWLICQQIEIPKVLEMYQGENETIYGKKQIPQYFFEYKFANTRTKLITETRAEIDKLPIEKSFKILCETCLNLINKNYHFAVFYSQGQKSFHIIIYDFDELKELSPYQRFKAQLKFWRNIFPFGFFQYMDVGINENNHYVPLEFAPHWKYGTIFDLILEYIPTQKEIPNKLFTDGGIVFNKNKKTGQIGFGFVLKQEGKTISKEAFYQKEGTTPIAEYLGIIAGLKKAIKSEIKELEVYSDSQLIINQINGNWNCWDITLKVLLEETKTLSSDFKKISFYWIPRYRNADADKLISDLLKPYRRKNAIITT